MKHLIDYVRGYLAKNEGNIEPVWNIDDSDFESDFEESLHLESNLKNIVNSKPAPRHCTPGALRYPTLTWCTITWFKLDTDCIS